MKLLDSVLDVFLPRTCLVCGRRLNHDESHICLYCLADFPMTHFWKREHNPMADKFNEIMNEVDGLHGESYAYACSLMFYSNNSPYKSILYDIKYKGNLQAGIFFGSMLGRHLAESRHLDDVDIIVPVPLHWRRQWKRGYNQAEVISQGIADELGAVIRTDILRRRRHTQTQTALDIDAKKANVKGAFVATGTFAAQMTLVPERTLTEDMALTSKRASTVDMTLAPERALLAKDHSGRNAPLHILLVDDVFTTGSTLFECFRALRKVFPPSVRISVATLGFVGGT